MSMGVCKQKYRTQAIWAQVKTKDLQYDLILTELKHRYQLYIY